MSQIDQGSRFIERKPFHPGSVLYHPHYEPDLATLRRTLLIHDCMRSIVPVDAGFQPSLALKKHLEILPDTFLPTPPEDDDVGIMSDYFTLSILQKAFEQISKDETANRLRAHFSHPRGSWEEKLSINGATYINAAKFTYAVYDYLKEYGLIFAEEDDGNFLVDERAASLIISYLAAKMSNRLAVRTLTDTDTSFLTSTACDVYSAYIRDKDAIFASSVLRLHLPANIQDMDHNSYLELRERYSELREEFPLYLEQLRQLYQIKDLKSSEDVLAAVSHLEKKLGASTNRIQQSNIGSRIREWTVYGLESALTVGAGLFPKYAFELAIGAIVIKGINAKLSPQPLHGQFDGVRSILFKANHDILRATRLPEFLGENLLVLT